MLNTTVDITASIVLHNEDFEELSSAINSFLSISGNKKLFLIDNAPIAKSKTAFDHRDVIYLQNNRNLGFASAHNQALKAIKKHSEFHLVLNPDVSFEPKVIHELIVQMKADTSIALSAPKVVYSNGELQYTARRYPRFVELMFRKLGLFSGYTSKQEYRDQDLNLPFNPDFLHGCFLLFRTRDFERIGGFDERYFLYMEDVDVCRKIDQIGKKKLYYPNVQIVHILKKGSAKNLKLFLIHLSSIVKYFKKWGIA